jgi:hypothetical protein
MAKAPLDSAAASFAQHIELEFERGIRPCLISQTQNSAVPVAGTCASIRGKDCQIASAARHARARTQCKAYASESP